MSKQARQVQNLILLGKLAFPIRFQKERSSVCGLEVESLSYNDQATFYALLTEKIPLADWRGRKWPEKMWAVHPPVMPNPNGITITNLPT